MNYHNGQKKEIKIVDVRTVDKLPEPEMALALAQPPTGKFCQESISKKNLNFPAKKNCVSPFDQNM